MTITAVTGQERAAAVASQRSSVCKDSCPAKVALSAFRSAVNCGSTALIFTGRTLRAIPTFFTKCRQLTGNGCRGFWGVIFSKQHLAMQLGAMTTVGAFYLLKHAIKLSAEARAEQGEWPNAVDKKVIAAGAALTFLVLTLVTRCAKPELKAYQMRRIQKVVTKAQESKVASTVNNATHRRARFIRAQRQGA